VTGPVGETVELHKRVTNFQNDLINEFIIRYLIPFVAYALYIEVLLEGNQIRSSALTCAKFYVLYV